jgi:hypothetical protein
MLKNENTTKQDEDLEDVYQDLLQRYQRVQKYAVMYIFLRKMMIEEFNDGSSESVDLIEAYISEHGTPENEDEFDEMMCYVIEAQIGHVIKEQNVTRH